MLGSKGPNSMPPVGKTAFDLAVNLLGVKFVLLDKDHVNLEGAKPVNCLPGSPNVSCKGPD